MSSALHGRNFAVGPVNNCAAYNTHLGREENPSAKGMCLDSSAEQPGEEMKTHFKV